MTSSAAATDAPDLASPDAREFEALAARLEVVAKRIRRAIEAPDELLTFWRRVGAPLYRAVAWKPKLSLWRVRRLCRLLVEARKNPGEVTLDRPALLRAAVTELESNVTQLERDYVLRGVVPVTELGWLWRLYGVVRRAHAHCQAPLDRFLLRQFAEVPELELAPPLTAKSPTVGPPVTAPGVDAALAAARAERDDLGRRRRLLEAARLLLIDAAAAVELEPTAVQHRQRYISQQISRIDRYQAAGVEPDERLVHQAQQALARRDVRRLHAVLSAIEEVSADDDDVARGRLGTRALDVMWGRLDRFSPEASRWSLLQSSADTYTEGFRGAVAAGYERGLARLPDLRRDHPDLPAAYFREAENYLSHDGVPASLSAALGVDGSFDVGSVLTPVRAIEENRRLVLVRQPTRELALVPAQTVEDVTRAHIGDPRSVMADLAAGRLLTRRYIEERIERTERTVLEGEVRVYVLDGSGSMVGDRARMRDAILLTELSTLATRLDDPLRRVRPMLFYTYFTESLEPMRRVATPDEALAAIEEVLSLVRAGNTNIQIALLAAFDVIRNARHEDENLARAQIVLVTDGVAPLVEGQLEAARRAVGDGPVGVSVIALGMENPILRRLAAKQRAAGERSFYQFMSDAEITSIVHGQTAGLPMHLPAERDPEIWQAEVTAVVDELVAGERQLDLEQMSHSGDLEASLQEVGLSLDEALDEGERAHFEALRQDRRALERRFDRWFPAPAEADGPELRLPGGADEVALAELAGLLGAVAEVLEVTGGDGLRRRAEAVELFRRMLADEAIPPWRYAKLLGQYPRRLAPALAALRALVAAGDEPAGAAREGR